METKVQKFLQNFKSFRVLEFQFPEIQSFRVSEFLTFKWKVLEFQFQNRILKKVRIGNEIPKGATWSDSVIKFKFSIVLCGVSTERQIAEGFLRSNF